MDFGNLKTIVLSFIPFLIPIIGIFLFICAIINPPKIIIDTLQENDFRNKTKYIKFRRLIFFIIGLGITVSSLLKIFGVINNINMSILIFIFIFLFFLSDYYISRKYLNK